MKRHVLSLAVPVLVLSIFAGCPRKPKGEVETSDAGTLQQELQAQGEPDAASVHCRDDLQCSFMGKSTQESKPQSPMYLDGCLERLTRFEIPGVSTIPETFFKRQPSIKEINVRGFAGTQSFEITLAPVFPREKTFEGMQFYEARYQGSHKLCQNQTYDDIDLDPKHAKTLSGLALAVPGYWDDKGAWQHGGGRSFTLSCLSGAVAKCVLWGYLPWSRSAGDEPLAPYHQACVQAARARYLPGHDKDPSFTCRGTQVDIYDRLGIQRQGNDAGLVFESLWGRDKPYCVARSRWGGCDAELAAADAGPTPLTCLDPLLDGGAAWPEGALIAIRSSISKLTENSRCPTDDLALCPGCKPKP
jgi:hypothetical protein